MSVAKPDWQVYIILCSDDTLYTGVTRDVAKRFAQHQSGDGAKYFRGRKPLEVVYQDGPFNKSEALKREAAIKRLSRKAKLALVEQYE